MIKFNIKKTLIFLLFNLLFLPCSIGQKLTEEQTKGWKEMNLKGKVKSIKASEFRGKHISDKVQKIKRTDSTVYIFNAVGNKIQENRYLSDGKVRSKVSYKYDIKGNQIEINRYVGLLGKFILKYDNKGNEIEVDDYGSEDGKLVGKFTSKYDEKGNKIERNKYYYTEDNNVHEFRETNKYDDKGNKIETNMVDMDRKGRFYKITYKYDDKNNKIEENTSDSKSTFKYDDRNNVIEANTYKPDGSPITTVIIKYEYDRNLNWTKAIYINSNTESGIAERIIEYY